jgi:alkylated DNA repair dioxygenase AlkB
MEPAFLAGGRAQGSRQGKGMAVGHEADSMLKGLRLVAGYLDRARQEALLAALREIMRVAPVYTPRMPKSGRPLSVRMTNCGPLGWMTDAAGYRYQETHPETGAPWPPIPEILIAAWRELARYPHPPEACLVNVYGPGRPHGAASGPRRGGHGGPGGLAVARRQLRVPDRRRTAQ